MLKNFKEIFDEEILERGYDYYLEDRVIKIIKTNDGYEAKVEGNRRYNVLLEIKDHEIIGLSCDCPCEFYCKHEAALIYAIENGDEVIDQQVKNNDLRKLINCIPVDELPKIIEEACLNDNTLFQQLAIRYNHDLTLKQKQGIREMLYNINQTEYDYFYSDDDYIDYVDELEKFIRNQVSDLINNHKLDFGYEMLKEAISEAVKYDVDEYEYWFDGLYNSIYEQLVDLYELGSNQFKTYFIGDLKKHLEDRIFSDVIESFLINYIKDNSFQNQLLNELDEMINNDNNGYYVIQKIELMKTMEYSDDEIESILDDYYEKPAVRDFLIRRYLQNNQELQAIDVLEDSIEIDGERSDYTKKLVKLYKNNNLLEKWALSAYQIILNNNYNIDDELYTELKEYYGDQKWQELKQEIYARASKAQLYEYYKLDDEHQKLFEQVKNESIKTLNKYEGYLKQYYPREILMIYRNYLIEFVQGAKNHSAYDTIEYYLNKMLTYPDGQEIVRTIKNEWITEFPSRLVLVKRLEKISC